MAELKTLYRRVVRSQDLADKYAALTIPAREDIVAKFALTLDKGGELSILFAEWLEESGADYIANAFRSWCENRIALAEADVEGAQAELVTQLVTDAPETVRAALEIADAKLAELEVGGEQLGEVTP